MEFDHGKLFHVNPIEPSYSHEPMAYAGNFDFNEQLERLKRMQDDIDKRNEEERRDTSNLINDIMSQSRIMMMGGRLRHAGGTYGAQD